MNIKEKLINNILDVEGGYVNDISDSGGETNRGITKSTADGAGYKGRMKDLTKNDAIKIYSDLYWSPLKLDLISHLSEGIAEEMLDTGVNMGVSRASKFLQRSLTALNGSNEYTSLVIDGSVGIKTTDALSIFLKKRREDGELVLINMLNSLQGSFYIELTERRKKDKKYVFGWFLNRVTIK